MRSLDMIEADALDEPREGLVSRASIDRGPMGGWVLLIDGCR